MLKHMVIGTFKIPGYSVNLRSIVNLSDGNSYNIETMQRTYHSILTKIKGSTVNLMDKDIIHH